MRWRDLVTGIALLLGIASSALSAGADRAAAANDRQREPRRVVLLYDERTDLPGLAMLDASLLRNLAADPASEVEVYREELELSRFPSRTHLPRLAAYLRDKYSAKHRRGGRPRSLTRLSWERADRLPRRARRLLRNRSEGTRGRVLPATSPASF
jgi:hypothetical protein